MVSPSLNLRIMIYFHKNECWFRETILCMNATRVSILSSADMLYVSLSVHTSEWKYHLNFSNLLKKAFQFSVLPPAPTTRLDDICLQRVSHDSSFSGHESWFYFRYDSLSYLNDLSKLIFLLMKDRLVSTSSHGFTKNEIRFFHKYFK